MHEKLTSKRFTACLLLCSLLIMEYAGCAMFFSPYTSQFNSTVLSSISKAHKPSSMNEGSHAGLDVAEAGKDCTEFRVYTPGQSRWQNLKYALPFFVSSYTIPIACQMYFTRLSDEIYTQFNSNRIAVFQHKTDGMK